MNKKSLLIIIELITLLLIIAFMVITNYVNYNPKIIIEGENKFKLGSYNLEKSGLTRLTEIVTMTEDMPKEYSIAYFEAEVNKTGNIKNFTLSLHVFDTNGEYLGIAGYVYSPNKITYTKPKIVTDMLAVKFNSNSTFSYLNEQIKKIPLKNQIAVSGLDRYVIRYQPYTQIESGVPIFDGRNDDDFLILSKEDYNNGIGGVSDGETNVVIRLYDGKSIASGQQYLYVFTPIDEQSAVGNQLSNMQCDYYINNGILKLTRNYGESWIETDITIDELNETMSFYKSQSLPNGSIYISNNETIPIAYFYSKNPILKILHPDTESWQTIDCFPNDEEFGREITRRVIGFVDSSFGYAALGTDWSMGAGENKMCYFTYDGGNTWTEKSLPLQCTSKTLIDFFMANKDIGIVSLDSGANENFPLLFITNNTANDWISIELPFSELPKDIQYLTDIENFEYSDDQYILTLGQGNYGVHKAVFKSNNLLNGWLFSHTYKSNIHTVG